MCGGVLLPFASFWKLLLLKYRERERVGCAYMHLMLLTTGNVACLGKP